MYPSQTGSCLPLRRRRSPRSPRRSCRPGQEPVRPETEHPSERNLSSADGSDSDAAALLVGEGSTAVTAVTDLTTVAKHRFLGVLGDGVESDVPAGTLDGKQVVAHLMLDEDEALPTPILGLVHLEELDRLVDDNGVSSCGEGNGLGSLWPGVLRTPGLRRHLLVPADE